MSVDGVRGKSYYEKRVAGALRGVYVNLVISRAMKLRRNHLSLVKRTVKSCDIGFVFLSDVREFPTWFSPTSRQSDLRQ
jgi:hypothetical protein